MIKIKQRGNFNNLEHFFERVKEVFKMSDLDKYGRAGVEALSAATPVDTGKTAESWSYKIEHQSEGKYSLSWHNTNSNQGIPIAILIQYGHGTGNGAYVMGRDFINPAMRPLFDKIANDIWEEVTR